MAVKSQSIPPLYLISEPIQLTIIEITVISYMAVMPSPIHVKISMPERFPVKIPAAREKTVPKISTANTFMPHKALTSTKRYGAIKSRLASFA